MRFFILVSAFALISTSAYADLAVVKDHFKTVINQTPYYTKVCKDVPVSGDKTGDALTGAIIGGIIGNNVTKNVDNGGAVGALLGGIIGHKNSKATGGVKRECYNEQHFKESVDRVYDYSTVTFVHEGRSYTLSFTK